jgi:hypothetical protein
MKKEKLLEVLRIAIMCIVLENEGSMSPSELGLFLECKKTLVSEYARAQISLMEKRTLPSRALQTSDLW